jgi:hypothetical protein
MCLYPISADLHQRQDRSGPDLHYLFTRKKDKYIGRSFTPLTSQERIDSECSAYLAVTMLHLFQKLLEYAAGCLASMQHHKLQRRQLYEACLC